jgi:hypothetical protein
MISKQSRSSLTPMSSSSNTNNSNNNNQTIQPSTRTIINTTNNGNNNNNTNNKPPIIIIGGTGDLGTQCVKQAREMGYPVIFTGRNKIKGELLQTQYGAQFRQVDLSKYQQISSFCLEIASTYSTIHMLVVGTSGIGPREQPKSKTDDGKEDNIMMINYLAPSFIIHYFFKSGTKINRIVLLTGFQLDYQVLPPLDSPLLTVDDATRYSCSKAAGYVFLCEHLRRNPDQAGAFLVLQPIKTNFYPEWMPNEIFPTLMTDVIEAFSELITTTTSSLALSSKSRGVPFVLRAGFKNNKMQELPLFKKKDNSLLFGNGDLVAELSYQAELYDATCNRHVGFLPSGIIIPSSTVTSSSSNNITSITVAQPLQDVNGGTGNLILSKKTSQRSSGANSSNNSPNKGGSRCLIM